MSRKRELLNESHYYFVGKEKSVDGKFYEPMY